MDVMTNIILPQPSACTGARTTLQHHAAAGNELPEENLQEVTSRALHFLQLQLSNWSETTSTASQVCSQTPTGHVSMCHPQQEPAYINLQLTLQSTM